MVAIMSAGDWLAVKSKLSRINEPPVVGMDGRLAIAGVTEEDTAVLKKHNIFLTHGIPQWFTYGGDNHRDYNRLIDCSGRGSV